MMDWETQIMQRHAETLIPKPGLRTMNVGHGMGIVDTAILTHDPSEHHIVEAHPQVHQRLREQGWYDKPNVHIHEGRWQDVLPKLVAQGVVLDAIYYDTFAEDYAALREFFAEYVVQLLAPDGKFGWYNGLGADRQICYDVYTKVSFTPVSWWQRQQQQQQQNMVVDWPADARACVLRFPRSISTRRASIRRGRTSMSLLVCTGARSGRARAGRTGPSTCTGCLSTRLSNRRVRCGRGRRGEWTKTLRITNSRFGPCPFSMSSQNASVFLPWWCEVSSVLVAVLVSVLAGIWRKMEPNCGW
jgi:hypothetical protein